MLKKIITIFFILIFGVNNFSVSAKENTTNIREANIGAFYSANNVLSAAINNSKLKLKIETELGNANTKKDVASIQSEIDQLKDYQKEPYQTKLQEIDAKIEEQLRLAREAQARAAQLARQRYIARNNNSDASSSDGIWAPSYGYAHSQADVDKGGLWQWQPGYYAAHRWTHEGKMIASTPNEVNINGQIYAYDHTEYGSHTEEYMPEHRLKNDGSIWMQTCTNRAGDFMVHRYVPKN